MTDKNHSVFAILSGVFFAINAFYEMLYFILSIGEITRGNGLYYMLYAFLNIGFAVCYIMFAIQMFARKKSAVLVVFASILVVLQFISVLTNVIPYSWILALSNYENIFFWLLQINLMVLLPNIFVSAFWVICFLGVFAKRKRINAPVIGMIIILAFCSLLAFLSNLYTLHESWEILGHMPIAWIRYLFYNINEFLAMMFAGIWLMKTAQQQLPQQPGYQEFVSTYRNNPQ